MEELDLVVRTAASLDVGENEVHGILRRTFEELGELLQFENRVNPNNRERIVDLFRAETRERIEKLNRRWGQGVDLLLAMERIGNIEDYLLPDILTDDDIERALTVLFKKLRKGLSEDEGALFLAEVFRRSPGLAKTKSGHQFGYMAMISSMYPEIVDMALAKLSTEEIQDLTSSDISRT